MTIPEFEPFANERRCPGCKAVVRADAQWCTLCYQDLRPAVAQTPGAADPEAPSAGVPERRGRHSKPVAAAQAADPSGTAGSPVAAGGALPADVERQVSVMLAQLSAASAMSVPRQLREPSGRIGVMLGGIVAVALAGYVLMAIVGSILH